MLSGMTGYNPAPRALGGRLPVFSYFTTRRAYILWKAFRKGV